MTTEAPMVLMNPNVNGKYEITNKELNEQLNFGTVFYSYVFTEQIRRLLF